MAEKDPNRPWLL